MPEKSRNLPNLFQPCLVVAVSPDRRDLEATARLFGRLNRKQVQRRNSHYRKAVISPIRPRKMTRMVTFPLCPLQRRTKIRARTKMAAVGAVSLSKVVHMAIVAAAMIPLRSWAVLLVYSTPAHSALPP